MFAFACTHLYMLVIVYSKTRQCKKQDHEKGEVSCQKLHM